MFHLRRIDDQLFDGGQRGIADAIQNHTLAGFQISKITRAESQACVRSGIVSQNFVPSFESIHNPRMFLWPIRVMLGVTSTIL